MKALSPRDVEQVAVFRNTERVGTLKRTAQGSRFEYEAKFFERYREMPGGIAIHLPYSRRVTETIGVNLHSYFAGLLPEGLRLKAMVSRLKTSEDDLFSLLVASGSDCVGDIFVVPEGQNPSLDREDAVLNESSSFQELWRQTIDSDTQPLIAGVQEKLSPSLINFPVKARGKRWLLKLNPDDKPELIDNELFFMRLAASCLGGVARVERVNDRHGVPGLLVARFDRLYDRTEKRWGGIHQEDCCQLLNRYPADKYRLSTREILDSLEVCGAPTVERRRVLELIAFSYLIGNGDLHGKNISIGQRGAQLQLTEAYDLLSTRPYGDKRLALKIERRDDNLKRSHLLSVAERHGVPAKALGLRLDEICEKVAVAVPRVKEIGFDDRRTKLLADTLSKRVHDLSD